jgi:hypothetical protein
MAVARLIGEPTGFASPAGDAVVLDPSGAGGLTLGKFRGDGEGRSLVPGGSGVGSLAAAGDEVAWSIAARGG